MNIHPIISGVRASGPSTLASLAIALSILGTDATAQSRWVFVNGERLSDAQVANLARMNCRDIPNGSYWLNTQTGAWGYAGNRQVQGTFGEACGSGAEQAGGQNQDGTYGPYATRRRAEEVAETYRQRGLRATWFHNGDGFYVRVSR